MRTNRIARKLNNNGGNSIMMALLLLLVATVVSIVIVTVALTSTMHVTDNKTSQQEYLACVSAAEMLRDGLNGSTYTQTVTETNNYTWSWSPWKGWTSTKSKSNTETTYDHGKQNREDMQSLIASISKDILTTNVSGQEKSFNVKVTGMEPESVTASFKLVYTGVATTGESLYELRFKFESKAEDSEGYRMSMVIPVKKGEAVAGEHTPTKTDRWGRTTETQKKTTTTVTWGGSGTNVKISKGWGAYDKQN